MPLVFRHEGFRFFFYSNEGQPLEPIHIHVRHGAAEATFWLHPVVRVAGSYGEGAKRQCARRSAQTNTEVERLFQKGGDDAASA